MIEAISYAYGNPASPYWSRDGVWQRGETIDRAKFFKIRVIASTILSVLDSNLARMPPGETTPVIELVPT